MAEESAEAAGEIPVEVWAARQRETTHEFNDHVRWCRPCRFDGINCDVAREIRSRWREARDAVRAARDN